MRVSISKYGEKTEEKRVSISKYGEKTENKRVSISKYEKKLRGNVLPLVDMGSVHVKTRGVGVLGGHILRVARIYLGDFRDLVSRTNSALGVSQI